MFDVNGEYRFSDAFSVFGSGLYTKANKMRKVAETQRRGAPGADRGEQLSRERRRPLNVETTPQTTESATMGTSNIRWASRTMRS